MSNMSITDALSRLRDPKPAGNNKWLAFCPCHDDGAKSGHRSLSIGEGDDGKLLLHCFAGCEYKDVAAALEIDQMKTPPSGGGKEIIATYDYLDSAGKLVYQVVRYHPKDFRQRRPDGAGGWIWNMTGIAAVPYRLPGLLAGIAARETVFITEGEKDCDRLTKKGLVTTCNHGGVGKWKDSHSQHFFEKTAVVIIPDNDEPGQKHANQIAKALSIQRKCKVKILSLPGIPDKGDVSDWLAAGGTADELRRLAKSTRLFGSEVKFSPTGATAAELVRREFPDPRWAVLNFLPEGLTILGGKPKIGKSWMGLGLGIAIATGGKAFGLVDVEQGEVLCLALEDTERRLKNRLLTVLREDPAPENLHFYTAWPKLDEGGLMLLDEWLGDHPQTRLVIIDTLQKVRAAMKFGQTFYAEDYAALDGLQKLAGASRVAILVVHHLKKMTEVDPVDMLSGTTGLSGCADAVWILKRDRAQADAVLFVVGRDFEDGEHAMKLHNDIMAWQIMGNAEEYRLSQKKRQILDYLRKKDEPAGPKEIAEALNEKENTLKVVLHRMYLADEIKKEGWGKYFITTVPLKGFCNVTISSNEKVTDVSVLDGNLCNLCNLGNVCNPVTLEGKVTEDMKRLHEENHECNLFNAIKAAPLADSSEKVTEVTVVTGESDIWDEIRAEQENHSKKGYKKGYR